MLVLSQSQSMSNKPVYINEDKYSQYSSILYVTFVPNLGAITT